MDEGRMRKYLVQEMNAEMCIRDRSDIEYIANNIMLMKDGELFYAGTAEDLVYVSYTHLDVYKRQVQNFAGG